MEKKNLFELWWTRAFPEARQAEIERFASNGKSFEEEIFRAGFIIGREIKDIKKELGIDE